jgi:hypothetical protein
MPRLVLAHSDAVRVVQIQIDVSTASTMDHAGGQEGDDRTAAQVARAAARNRPRADPRRNARPRGDFLRETFAEATSRRQQNARLQVAADRERDRSAQFSAQRGEYERQQYHQGIIDPLTRSLSVGVRQEAAARVPLDAVGGV